MTLPEIDAIDARLLQALRAKLRVRAGTLAKGMRRAGRQLPREAHRATEVLSAARRDVANPKLARMVDEASLSAAEATIMRHLDKIDPASRRKDAWLSMAGAQALNLLGVGALVLGLLLWRGLL